MYSPARDQLPLEPAGQRTQPLSLDKRVVVVAATDDSADYAEFATVIRSGGRERTDATSVWVVDLAASPAHVDSLRRTVLMPPAGASDDADARARVLEAASAAGVDVAAAGALPSTCRIASLKLLADIQTLANLPARPSLEMLALITGIDCAGSYCVLHVSSSFRLASAEEQLHLERLVSKGRLVRLAPPPRGAA